MGRVKVEVTQPTPEATGTFPGKLFTGNFLCFACSACGLPVADVRAHLLEKLHCRYTASPILIEALDAHAGPEILQIILVRFLCGLVHAFPWVTGRLRPAHSIRWKY